MYQLSDYGIRKFIDNDWYMVVWGDHTMLTAFNQKEADNLFNQNRQPNVPIVVYNPDGTLYKSWKTEKIPDWDPAMRWGNKTPKEAAKMLRKEPIHEKNRKPLFKLF